MAHQAHNIPWTNLASNLKYRDTTPCKGRATDFHLRGRPDQGVKFKYFITAFARNIHAHADTERKKYPDKHDPPARDEVIITDDAAVKITPTIARRWAAYEDSPQNQKDAVWSSPGQSGRRLTLGSRPPRTLCRRAKDDAACHCALRLSDRKMEAFLQKMPWNLWGPYNFVAHGFKTGVFHSEIFQALILYGEMDTVLRIAAHPDNDMQRWRCACNQGYNQYTDDIGWQRISDMAISAYILLNVIYCLPETWSPSEQGESKKDYRRTQTYQELVRKLCGEQEADVVAFPHRQFFGLRYARRFAAYPGISSPAPKEYLDRVGAGYLPYENYIEGLSRSWGSSVDSYEASSEDVSRIRGMLCHKGLPVELAQDIMDLAGFEVERRLPVAHDPFHKDNEAELLRYLKYCWQLIVRCEVLARELSLSIEWEKEIGDMLLLLFDCGCTPGVASFIWVDQLKDYRYVFR